MARPRRKPSGRGTQGNFSKPNGADDYFLRLPRSRIRIFRTYLTEMVTVLLAAPPAVTTIGYSPRGRLGMRMFAWVSPMKPGVKPANTTSAAEPPTVTVTGAIVCESGSPGATAPVGTGLSKRPPPVRYTTT